MWCREFCCCLRRRVRLWIGLLAHWDPLATSCQQSEDSRAVCLNSVRDNAVLQLVWIVLNVTLNANFSPSRMLIIPNNCRLSRPIPYLAWTNRRFTHWFCIVYCTVLESAPSPGWGPRGHGPSKTRQSPSKNNWTDHVLSGLPDKN